MTVIYCGLNWFILGQMVRLSLGAKYTTSDLDLFAIREWRIKKGSPKTPYRQLHG